MLETSPEIILVHIDNLEVGLEAVRGTNVTDILVIPSEDNGPVPEGFVSISELKRSRSLAWRRTIGTDLETKTALVRDLVILRELGMDLEIY